MPRASQLREFWAWLPAFRAVAESEHLPTAAAVLGVTPSAASRTIRQLETALGHPLFERIGRRLRLNHAGKELLSVTRLGMRLIHSGVERAAGPAFARDLRIGGSGLATLACALPVVLEMTQAHPDLVAHVQVLKPEDVAGALLRGDIDLGVLTASVEHPGLDVRALGHATSGVYCAATHPLASTPSVSFEAVSDYPFAAPPANERGQTTEGWPTEVPRRIALRAAEMHVGAEACKGGSLLAVLPDHLGQLHRLVRLQTPELPPIPLVAVHRRHLPGGPDFAPILRALANALRRAGGHVDPSWGEG